jgi:hypothetical protein
MIVHQVFAQISQDEVKNVMVCEDYETANCVTRATYGEEAYAVDCLQYACKIGDKYHDGYFWRTGDDGAEEQIPYTPTQEQEVELLNNQLAEVQEENTTLQMAITEQYEDNLALQEEVTSTQLAITEIYEKMEG